MRRRRIVHCRRSPIPLTDGDPDVSLDLQTVFTTTYDRAGYDYALATATRSTTTAVWHRH